MNEPREVSPLYLTVEEVAKRLRLGRTKVYELIAYEKLPVTRFGRCVRVNPARLQEWLNERDSQSA
jgi:excisionase family DNA binding protein